MALDINGNRIKAGDTVIRVESSISNGNWERYSNGDVNQQWVVAKVEGDHAVWIKNTNSGHWNSDRFELVPEEESVADIAKGMKPDGWQLEIVAEFSFGEAPSISNIVTTHATKAEAKDAGKKSRYQDDSNNVRIISRTVYRRMKCADGTIVLLKS